ncbi:MAG: bifunctional demethylmenaquinone methyltransferase/2-methoxy-6-polyprenyl-1,4-benzoquinol methylase UbiE [Gammaproteobacteria bacterium]|nr:bifunctional demethylmenaquinone methyltransferase/2-methoxy-6-polyprenyl-1,4-benzoquinol methylase UbiE [Gammaproteobacteria bacterium]
MDEKKTHFGYEDVSWQEKQSRVNQVFSSVAKRYDVMNDLMSLGLHRLWKDEAVRMLSPQEGETILDLAGGTGDLSKRILKRMHGRGRVILTDINLNMLREGVKRFDRTGQFSDLDYGVVNAEALPFQDASLDAITIAFGLRNVRDQATALAEMFRVLKPGGRALILEFSKMKGPLAKPYDWYSFHILPKMGQLVTGDADSYRYLAESIRKHPEQVVLKTMLEQAGFSEVHYRNILQGLVAIHLARKA